MSGCVEMFCVVRDVFWKSMGKIFVFVLFYVFWIVYGKELERLEISDLILRLFYFSFVVIDFLEL